MTMSDDVLIIGGGLGGLFTGAILARTGHRVTVLERHHTAGGGLQTFLRRGFAFETGMHMLGGMRPGGSVMRLCRWLGIADHLNLRHADADCMDQVTYLGPGDTYRLPEGREAFTQYLIGCFPAERAGIERYVASLYRMADEVDLFNLRPSELQMRPHGNDFLMPADEWIARYVRDLRLRDLLAYMNPMYGGVAGHTPAYVHALINVLYINGTDRFVGGSQPLANALTGVIEQGGGRVLTDHDVLAVDVADRQVAAVHTAHQTFTARHYISAVHPWVLFKLMGEQGFSPAYRARLRSVSNSYSAFILFIIFRPGTFPYINHTCYYQEDYGHVWTHGNYDETDWPRGFMYMTPCDAGQGPWATKMIVNCLMPYSAVERWAHTTTGHRGADYEQWKQLRCRQVLDKLEQLYPGFAAKVETFYSSSPLTIRDYYNQPEGSLYGLQKDCRDIAASQIAVVTRVRNLLLTGQNVNLHGICGVPLTAITTAEAIEGPNEIIRRINRET